MPEVVFIRADLSTFKVNLPDLFPFYQVLNEEQSALAQRGMSVGQALGSFLAQSVPMVLDTYEKQVLRYELEEGDRREVVTYRYLRTERSTLPAVPQAKRPNNGPK